MIYIHDMEDYRGDFGSTGTVTFFEEVANRLNLKNLLKFLDEATTIDIREVIKEIESVDWPLIDGHNEVAAEVVGALLKCRGIAFLE